MTKTAAIIGGGVIGGGWLARFLLNGWDVHLFDPDPHAKRKIEAVLKNARTHCRCYTTRPCQTKARSHIAKPWNRPLNRPIGSKKACQSVWTSNTRSWPKSKPIVVQMRSSVRQHRGLNHRNCRKNRIGPIRLWSAIRSTPSICYP